MQVNLSFCRYNIYEEMEEREGEREGERKEEKGKEIKGKEGKKGRREGAYLNA